MGFQLPNAKKPGQHMGVNYDPNQPPATMGGDRREPKTSMPKFEPAPGWSPPGTPPPPPGVGPTLPPSTAPVFPQDPGPMQAFNGGYFNPTEAPNGFDLSQPGQQEQFWNNNQSLWFQSPNMDWVESQLPQFQDPWFGETWNQNNMGGIGKEGAGQNYWHGISGSFNTMGDNVVGGYTGPNRAAEAYELTKGMLPGSMQPQFDAYYDRMKDKAMSDVNAQSASRGAYGSNAALNSSIGTGLDIEAQRAKAATDFMLEDSANQRAWQDTLGGQARNADISGLDAFDRDLRGAQFGLDRTKLGGDLAFEAERMAFDKDKTLSDIAFGIDDHRRNRLDSGISTGIAAHEARQRQVNDAFDASGAAQDAFENRTNNLYDDQTNFSQDVLSFFGDNYDALFAGDEANFQQQLQTMIGQTADQRGWDVATQQRIMQEAQAIYDMIKGNEAEGIAKGK